MAAELTPEERDFIERFELEHSTDELEDEIAEEEVVYHRERLRSRVFNFFVGLFMVAPFLFSGFFLYTLAHYDSVIGEGGLRTLARELTGQELEEMAQETGLPEIKLFVSLYDDRWTVIGIIFAVFIALILLMYAARGFITYLRNRNG